MNLRHAVLPAVIACLVPGVQGCGKDSPTAPETLPATPETVQAGVDLITTGQLAVVGTCSGTTPINCPGGTLASPKQLVLTRTAVAVVPVPAASRYDFSATVSVVSSIPVTLPVVGECTLGIDTAPGTSPTITITGSAAFASHTTNGPIDRLVISNVVVTGFETADLTLSGSLGCAAASASLGIYLDQIQALISQIGGELCPAPGPPLLEVCPQQP